MRPTKRPARPYTDRQIIDRVRRHFIEENNPRCVDEDDGCCTYAGSGCAVGCLVTARDARTFERHRGIDTSINAIFAAYPTIFRAYFKPEQLPMLESLQHSHDVESIGFRKRMAAALDAEEARLKEGK